MPAREQVRDSKHLLLSVRKPLRQEQGMCFEGAWRWLREGAGALMAAWLAIPQVLQIRAQRRRPGQGTGLGLAHGHDAPDL